MKTRDFLFDNYRAFLIIFVVLGHFIEPSYTETAYLTNLKYFIFAFHMPAFIFISGYFAVKKSSPGKLIQKLLVPYLIFEVIYYFTYENIIHKETELDLLYPKFSLWFLLAIFCYKLVIHYAVRIPYHLPLAILGGLAIGFFGMASNFISIPRIVYFFPFFILGYHFREKDILGKVRRSRYAKGFTAAAVLVIAAFILYLALDTAHLDVTPKIFYGRYNYDFLEQTPLTGIAVRIVAYFVGALLTLALLFVMPKGETPFSKLGRDTMSVYLFHGLVYNYLKDATELLDDVTTAGNFVLLFMGVLATVYLFSRKPFVEFTNRISSLDPAPALRRDTSA